jgi:hypothetical protein
MDNIDVSKAQLIAPICQACSTEMTWVRSALVEAERSIMHIFACPKCSSVNETNAPIASRERYSAIF